jgi:lysophospholipase L1-like esterase
MTRRAFAVCALLGVLGCARRELPASGERSGEARANPSPGAAIIAVLGSSTAAGHGLADRSEGWVGRYASYVSPRGFQIQNLAVDGYTTFHVLPSGTARAPGRPAVDEAHNVTAALAYRPKAIVVNLPSNDAALGVSVDESLRNIRLVVTKAAEAGVPVWVTTSQPRVLDRPRTELLVAMRDRVVSEFAGRALDFWTPLASPSGAPLPEYNQGDGIHPNAIGHRLLFDQVKRADIPAALAADAPGATPDAFVP